MSTASLAASTRKLVLRLFPWLTRCGIAPSGALALRGAAGRTELEGGGAPLGRVGDEASQIQFYPGVPAVTPPSLWISYDHGATWAACIATIVTGPPPNTPGSPIRITAGSSRVTCG